MADGLRDQIQAAVKEKTATAALLKDAQTLGERLRNELKATTERVEAAGRQLEEARKTVEKLETARTELTSARDEQSAARKTAEGDLRKARETVDALRAECDGRKSLERTAERSPPGKPPPPHGHSGPPSGSLPPEPDERVAREDARAGAGIRAADQAPEGPGRTAARRRPRRPRRFSKNCSRLPGAGGRVDLSGCSRRRRADGRAVPRVRCSASRRATSGRHQIGFDPRPTRQQAVLPAPGGFAALARRQLGTDRDAHRRGRDGANTVQRHADCAIAVPIVVGGDTLAIVYADDSGAPKSARGAVDVRARYADAVRHYAVALLTRVTKELKALAELQKYAASLLHEMEQMYDADVESGISGADLQKRLTGNLDFARSIYGSRTALEGADAATLLDDELGAPSTPARVRRSPATCGGSRPSIRPKRRSL